MSGFKPYPAYKNSGIKWLGEVPEHWADRKIARDIPFVVGWTPPSGKDEYYDGELPWVTIADMTQMSVDDTKSKISHIAVQDKGAKIVPAGSMLFSFKLSVGKVAFLTIDSYTNEAIAGFLPSGPLDLNFWKYSAPEFIPMYGRENIYGATLLNQELISSVRFFAPAKAEQTQIARFLDYEAARIDALIEEQQRLIELLKEKRQAVISHAVTKGLDPTVPMKDSGVEWLGEVPAHWAVADLKWYWSVTDCKHVTAEFVDDGIPLASIREVQSRYVALDNAKQTTEVFYRQLIEGGRELVAGDLIFSRNATVGEVAQVAHWHPPFAMGQDVCVLKKQYEWLSSDYLQAVLRSPVVIVQLDSLMIGSTFKRVNVEDIRGIIVPMPPQEEQQIIAEYLLHEAAIFDSLLSAAQSTIAFLQERRSALISAAVTGKIDVRGWQPPASVQVPESAQEAM